MSLSRIEIPLAKDLSDADVDAIARLISDLAAMGIDIKIPSPLPGGILAFEYDKEAYKRNAGRKRKEVPTKSPLRDMTQEQTDLWLLDNSIEAVQQELGVSRTTAFRRRAEARKRISYASISLDMDEVPQ